MSVQAHDELGSDAIPGMDIFVLRIRLGNDAMSEPSDIARALSQASVDVLYDRGRVILDENGNTVGGWAFHFCADAPESTAER